VADIDDLTESGFARCRVTARTLGIVHPDPGGLGPFCRLDVEDSAPEHPGVYAWVIDQTVMYVGKAKVLRQIIRGSRMQRAYNDYTYIPASKVQQVSNPRVRVNGLLNAALSEGHEVTWWWRVSIDETTAFAEEAGLIAAWSPPWNRARPIGPLPPP
jgi:hypothetical protein